MKPTRVALWLAASALGVTIACASDARESEPRESEHRGKARVSKEALTKGQGLYKNTCAPCHGEGGKGDGPAGKIFKPPPQDHTNAAYMDTISDEEMVKTINYGGALKGKPSMPSNPQIRGEDMTALVAYVRSLSRPDR
jgi:mono/diheme cytochrome c family protein